MNGSLRCNRLGLAGLLRVGSPVWRLGEDEPVRGVLVAVGDEVAAFAYEDGGQSAVEDDVPLADVALALDDGTGRIHLVWWLRAFLRGTGPVPQTIPDLRYFGLGQIEVIRAEAVVEKILADEEVTVEDLQPLLYVVDWTLTRLERSLRVGGSNA
jgi:hypothetical protein